MRVEDHKRAESCIRDGVKAASSERSDTQGDQAQSNESVYCMYEHEGNFSGFGCLSSKAKLHEPLERPVVATVCGVRVRDGGRVVHCRCQSQCLD